MTVQRLVSRGQPRIYKEWPLLGRARDKQCHKHCACAPRLSPRYHSNDLLHYTNESRARATALREEGVRARRLHNAIHRAHRGRGRGGEPKHRKGPVKGDQGARPAGAKGAEVQQGRQGVGDGPEPNSTCAVVRQGEGGGQGGQQWTYGAPVWLEPLG
jgi:hypothetical protein